MDTQTLLRLAHSDPIITRRFGGVFASDLLPKNRGYYRSFIVNTDSSLEKGTHWQAIYFDNKDKCTFFCSYGTYPVGNIKKFIDNNSTQMEWNSKILQHPKTISCGLFCLYFLWHLTRGLSIDRLREINACENERIVARFAQTQFKLTNHSTLLTSNQQCKSLQNMSKSKNQRYINRNISCEFR
ncbi:hypothetical protein AVEN_223522-1 [Araneus ventricosus]|uniref:Ubiquitin-like protease family profile domain-containing protein n=1 Tax=Araneus ventricosus TaxID=182803 RepID=A0A4Y2PEZ6_ARAVE|nr:hypothetical protein AVEN_223522-1 [Araneus ventricosus]